MSIKGRGFLLEENDESKGTQSHAIVIADRETIAKLYAYKKMVYKDAYVKMPIIGNRVKMRLIGITEYQDCNKHLCTFSDLFTGQIEFWVKPVKYIYGEGSDKVMGLKLTAKKIRGAK